LDFEVEIFAEICGIISRKSFSKKKLNRIIGWRKYLFYFWFADFVGKAKKAALYL